MEVKEKAREFIIGMQKFHLIKKYGLHYEDKIPTLNTDQLFDFVEKSLEAKTDLTEDEKFEIEAKLKGALLESNFLNTEFESPESWMLLKSLVDEINELMPTENELPFFGTVLSGEVNASAYCGENNEYKVVLFEAELFTCANLLCKLVAQSIPLSDKKTLSFSLDEEVLKKQMDNSSLVERILDFLNNSVHGEPSKAKQYFLESDQVEHLHAILLKSLEYFVLGHEYGHIYLDHLNTNSTEKIENFDSDIQAEKISLEWQQEYESDFFSLALLLTLEGKWGQFPLSVLGPDILFSFFSLKEEILGINSKKQDSHPPSKDRKEKIRNVLLASVDEEGQIVLVKTFELLDKIFAKFKELYEKQQLTIRTQNQVGASLPG